MLTLLLSFAFVKLMMKLRDLSSVQEFMNSFPQLTQREKEKLYYIYTRV